MPWRAFFPDEVQGGGVSPGKRLNVDSGVLNPSHMDHLGPIVAKAWAKSRLRDRFDTVTAHEFEEAEHGTHEAAVEHAPDTALPVSHASRELSRRIRDAERGR